jgi:DNA-nicking Smr family endonuclease
MPSETDKALFRSSVNTDFITDKDKKLNQPKHRQPVFTEYGLIYEPYLSASDALNYAKPGISAKIIKKMKRADVGSPPSLDLHGNNKEQTCQLLSNFIHRYQHIQFVHIIHGKGFNSSESKSVIKSQVDHFLKQHPQVMAFHSCPPKEGGTGAVFVLLKSN